MHKKIRPACLFEYERNLRLNNTVLKQRIHVENEFIVTVLLTHTYQIPRLKPERKLACGFQHIKVQIVI